MTDATAITFTQDETSAVQRTVAKKLYEAVSVKDFGAVGNGTSDDTSYIQAALTDLQTGGQLFFSPGTYLIPRQVTCTIANNVSISISGAGSDASILYFPSNGGVLEAVARKPICTTFARIKPTAGRC